MHNIIIAESIQRGGKQTISIYQIYGKDLPFEYIQHQGINRLIKKKKKVYIDLYNGHEPTFFIDLGQFGSNSYKKLIYTNKRYTG